MPDLYMSEYGVQKCRRLYHQSRRLDRCWDGMNEKGTLQHGRNMRRLITIQDRVRVRMGIAMETTLLMNPQ